jgi:class 3 adenylate cyclase
MSTTSFSNYLKQKITAITELGDQVQDNEDEKLEHHFLIYMGSLMGCGGVIWGSISFYYGLYPASIIPFSYTALTIFNFTLFYISKNFRRARFNQVLISLLLPFVFQWRLGGFIPSGAVMLWSMIALVGSMTFQDVKLSVRWLIAYLLFTIISGLIDSVVNEFRIDVPSHIITLFFVVNIAIISAIVFGLNIYLLAKREESKAKLAEMTSLLKKMFGRYLSTEVMNTIIENPSALELGGERRKVTIMMTDLRGFTALSERLEPEQVVQMLNSYFEIMVEVVLKYNGTINEFIGDALLVIFGAPQEMSDRAQRAIACAIEMQSAMAEVNEQNREKALPELEMGIGLNETEVIVGNIGSSKRSKYAVVGSGVNMTSRIESYTVGGQILISESVRKEVGNILRIDRQREVLPKGAETSFLIYEVGGISGQYNLVLEEKGLSMATLTQALPILFTVFEDKKIEKKGIEGTMVQLSEKSAVVSLGVLLEPMTNLKMNLEDVDEKLASYDFYGKVVEHSVKNGNHHTLRFTSVPPEVDAYFKAHLCYAENSASRE